MTSESNDEIPCNYAVDRRSMQLRVVATLRERIVSGEFEPGTALSEVLMAKQFAVSRTPIREAFKQLEVEGLVQIRSQVGTFVAAPTDKEVWEMSSIREVLEGLAARQLAERRTKDDLVELNANIRRSRIAVEKGEVDLYAGLVAEFHSLILDRCGNAKLQDHHKLLINQLAYPLLVKTSLRNPGRPVTSLAEHEEIVSEIDAGNAIGAEVAMRRHAECSRKSTSPPTQN